MPPTSISAPLRRISWDIKDCSIGELPVNLRIVFDPIQNLAYFRLRAIVNALSSTSFRQIYLDISPDNIQTLTLRLETPISLRFHIAAAALVVPKDLDARSITDADRITLNTLWSFAQQDALVVSLPNKVDDLPNLAALCEAADRGGLRPDPGQIDLKTLYRGKGGRVVQADDDLWIGSDLSPTVPSPTISRASPPPSNLFPTTPGDEAPPPTYASLASPPPAPPLSPVYPRKDRKRLRTRSNSISPDSSPEYRTWKHFDLAVGDRERMMAELLCRIEAKQEAFRKVMSDLDAKYTRAQEAIAELAELNSKAEGNAAVLRGAGGSLLVHEEQADAFKPSQISTISASALAAASPGSSTSVASNISGRVQAYVDAQIDQLREELARKYVDNESLEQCVGDQVDTMLSHCVEEHQVIEMIEEAIGDAMTKLRHRMVEALE